MLNIEGRISFLFIQAKYNSLFESQSTDYELIYKNDTKYVIKCKLLFKHFVVQWIVNKIQGKIISMWYDSLTE
jgi:hypothetical protein